MNKPILVERYADNGEFSHWALIQEETGELLWSEAPEEEMQQVKNCSIHAVVWRSEQLVCDSHSPDLEHFMKYSESICKKCKQKV